MSNVAENEQPGQQGDDNQNPPADMTIADLQRTILEMQRQILQMQHHMQQGVQTRIQQRRVNDGRQGNLSSNGTVNSNGAPNQTNSVASAIPLVMDPSLQRSGDNVVETPESCTIQNIHRLSDMYSVKLSTNMKNFKYVRMAISKVLCAVGITMEMQQDMFDGAKVPSNDLDQFIMMCIDSMMKHNTDLRPRFYDIQMSDAVNKGPQMLYQASVLYERKSMHTKLQAQGLSEMRFTHGSLTTYNTRYLKEYNDLVSCGKMTPQEWNCDTYLKSLGDHPFVNLTIRDLDRHPWLQDLYKSGDIAAITIQAEKNFLLFYQDGSMPPQVNSAVTTQTSNEKVNSDSHAQDQDKSSIRCYNCNKHGHISRNCPKPQRKRNGNRNRDNASNTPTTQESSDNLGNAFIADEFFANATIALHLDEDVYDPLGIFNEQIFVNSTIGNSHQLLVDSCCSFSVTGRKELLTNIRKSDNPGEAQLINSSKMKYSLIGDMEIMGTTLPVYYSETMTTMYSLIGLQDLIDHNINVDFSRNTITSDTEQRTLDRWCRCWAISPAVPSTIAAAVVDHAAVGHASKHRCQELDIKHKSFDCDSCKLSNTKLGALRQYNRFSISIQDNSIYGDFKVFTHGLILVLIETKHHEISVTYMKSKDKAITALMKFIKSLDYLPDKLITDMDPAFTAASFKRQVQHIGLDLQYVPPSRHQLNYSERLIQDVMVMIRSIIHGREMKNQPVKILLPYICKYVQFNINRLYMEALKTSPFAHRYGKQPDPKLFIPFAKRFAFRMLNLSSNLNQKGMEGLFMGLDPQGIVPTAILYVPNRRSFVRRALADISPLSQQSETEPKGNTNDLQDDNNLDSYKDYFSKAFKSGLMIEDDDENNKTLPPIRIRRPEPNADSNDIDHGLNYQTNANPVRRSQRTRRPRELYDPQAEADRPQWGTGIIANAVVVANAAIRGWEFSKLSPAERKEWTIPLLTELRNMKDHDVIRDCDPNTIPDNAQIINSSWVLETKRDNRRRARLVARGDQLRTLPKSERYSPTAQPMLVLILLFLLVNTLGFTAKSLDVSAAFLNGRQRLENVYMRAAPPMDNKIFKLVGNLYGLSNASLIWYLCLIAALLSFGLIVSSVDKCLLYGPDYDIFMVVHVDDFLVVGLNSRIEALVEFLNTKFKLKSVSLSDYVGLNIETNSKGEVFISQRKYLTSILDRFQMTESKAVSTPMEPGQRRTLQKSPKCDPDLLKLFQRQCGSLVYLHLSRPDLDFVRLMSSTCASNPQPVNFIDMKRAYRYLANTIDLGYHIIPSHGKVCLHAYSDASFLKDEPSISGYMIFLDKLLIAHKSAKQTIISDSSCQAEMAALALCLKRMTYVMLILDELKIQYTRPVIRVDNKAVLDILQKDNPATSKSAHFIPLTNFCRQYTTKIDIVYVPTKDNIADMGTKSLDKSQHQYLTGQLLVPRPQSFSKCH